MDAPLCQRKDRHRATGKDYSSIVIHFTVVKAFLSFFWIPNTLLLSLSERSAKVMHLGLLVCMSVQTRNSKTIAPIDLIALHKKYYTRGSVL